MAGPAFLLLLVDLFLIPSMSLHLSHRHKTYTAVKNAIHTFQSSRKLPLWLNDVFLRCPPTPTLVCTSNLRAHLSSAPLPNFRHFFPFQSTSPNVRLLLCHPLRIRHHPPLVVIITTVIRSSFTSNPFHIIQRSYYSSSFRHPIVSTLP